MAGVSLGLVAANPSPAHAFEARQTRPENVSYGPKLGCWELQGDNKGMGWGTYEGIC